VYGRDYSAPTGEDNFDKSALPEVMQVSRRCSFAHGSKPSYTFMTGVGRAYDEPVPTERGSGQGV
jgi:hypothetical protein